jgi:hypothetical protein
LSFWRRATRCRGEYVERSFAHVYDTGGMRRTPRARASEHPQAPARAASAFNLGVLMRRSGAARYAQEWMKRRYFGIDMPRINVEDARHLHVPSSGHRSAL